MAFLAACAPGDRGAAPARRVEVQRVELDAEGVSQPVSVVVPEHTRSVTIVVRGAPEALYALTWLQTADGVEHVGSVPGVAPGVAMRARYEGEKVGLMPGTLYQSIRLGLFTQVFPDRPDRALPAGPLTLRVASAGSRAPVDVEVLMPEEDGARRLPIQIFALTDELEAELPFLDTTRELLAAGGVDLDVADRVIPLPARALTADSEASQPQEPPSSASSQLALAGGAMVDGDALAIYIVDALPGGVAGWSLGTPGPPLPDTVYSGVVVARAGDPREVGRVLAHEIAHYLGVAHVENVSASGRRYPDALDDTQPGSGNLMEGGRTLTRDQAWVLSRSALLR